MTVDKVRALEAQQSAKMKAEYKDIKKGLNKTFTRKKKKKKEKKGEKVNNLETNISNSGNSGNSGNSENNNEYFGNENNKQNAGNLTQKSKRNCKINSNKIKSKKRKHF